MPNSFKRKLSRGVSSSLVSVNNYTVPASTQVTVIGLVLSNVANGVTNYVTATHYDGTADTYLVKDAPVLQGASLVVVGGEQKLVLEAGDSVRVSSTLANGVDVVMSILEIT
jgi:hypothetical protein